MVNYLTIDEQALSQRLMNYRREFHRYPESAWCEFFTTSRIAAHLKLLGYELCFSDEIIARETVMGRDESSVAKAQERAISWGADFEFLAQMDGITGVGAILDTGRPGPVIALRFDIDAVDVMESQEDSHRPRFLGFASLAPGVAHACGHDAHASIGLGIAEVLAEHKDALCGKIKLIFQPAEEGCRAGKAIAESGWLDDVDYFLAAHIGMNVPSGTLVCDPQHFLCSSKFDLHFTGKPAHAGIEPNAGRNALAAACTAVSQMLAIPRHRDGMTRINVGQMHAGDGRNVIPANAVLMGETRGENRELNDYMYQQVERIAEASAAIHGVKVEIKAQGEAIGLHNDLEMVELLETIGLHSGFSHVLREKDFGASEDAGYLVDRVQQKGGKAIYCLVGSNLTAGHHNGDFDIDESRMLPAVKLFINAITQIHSTIPQEDVVNR
ncbi:Catalyzes the cleavage of p-aminobenzoyl-glutamate to p-aminobenzoate and glutamate, subunit A [Photobacterium marinum]|uniref:Catalyzes the cleavage of p-aminobenzoyl-glutamate to p-aminobenzoate and glutamate, subunit A n=1 Tax=Photobacterium marinum TaxID=1056511 RepID=L8JK50_9GAMM|nr:MULTISPECIES: amidohydrolase [Photobacterium]ELR67792.1 Catalyzes the cleavage of p-aminobenzoyl-glutamate to p-aminobenzoate and glutamate, subunit A [Photobacterium marinum]